MNIYSFSKIETYLSCSWQYYLKYVERLKTINTSSNLVFGKVIHAIISKCFVNTSFNSDDAKDMFIELFSEYKQKYLISYSANYPEKDLIKLGLVLASKIPEHIKRSNLVIFPIDGKPSVDVPFNIQLTESITLRGYIDLIVYHLIREAFGVVDAKTSSQPTEDFMPCASSQLTAYSLTDLLPNFPSYDFVGFWDFQKRKVTKTGKGPEIHPLMTSEPPTDERRKMFVDQIISIDEQIGKEQFFKTPRSNHNSPCKMCDYKNFCLRGDRSLLTT